MKDTYFTLIKNERIAKNTYLSVLEGDTSDITASGQFVNIKLDGFYLRRPISVCNVEGNLLTIIYKAVGAGTEKMATTEAAPLSQAQKKSKAEFQRHTRTITIKL